MQETQQVAAKNHHLNRLIYFMFLQFELSLNGLSSWFSMSEDDGHESGCDTVEGSPTSDTSTSPSGNSTYRYLNNNNNRPPLSAMVAPLPSPTEQGRSPRGIRTMIVPPLRVQNTTTTQGTEERVQRMGPWRSLFCLIYLLVSSLVKQDISTFECTFLLGALASCHLFFGGVCFAGHTETVWASRPLVANRGYNRWCRDSSRELNTL